MKKDKREKNTTSTKLVSENMVTVCYPEPLHINTYSKNRKLKIFDDVKVSDEAIKYTSDHKIYLISYVRQGYNDKQKAREHPIIVLYFNGCHLVVFDVSDNAIKTLFLDRINKIMINGVKITFKKFLLSNGFKYKLIHRYLRDMSFRFVIRLIIQNFRIQVQSELKSPTP